MLQRAAVDIVRPFSENPGSEVFARRFRSARECVAALRLGFSDPSSTKATLARLKLENLDSGILGGEFPESEITITPSTDHFGLMSTEQVLRQLDEPVVDTH